MRTLRILATWFAAGALLASCGRTITGVRPCTEATADTVYTIGDNVTVLECWGRG